MTEAASGLTIPSPRDRSWGDPPLPDWLESFRDIQWEGAQQVIERFAAGYKVILLEAPTGVGKTLLAEVVRRQMQTRALYLVGTKQLQTQIEDRMPYAAVLWGRANYPTRNHLERFPELNASFCDKSEDHACDFCLGDLDDGEQGCTYCCPDISACPYEVAKHRALSAQLAVTNYTYFLTEANYVGRFGERRSKAGKVWRQPLIIADECDTLEDHLMGFVEVNISPRRRKQFGIAAPKRKTVEEAWVEWVEPTRMQVGAHLARIPRNTTDPRKMKDRQWLERLQGRLSGLEKALGGGGWVYDDRGGESITFRPVRVDREARGSLWRHGDRFVCMSATICAPEVMAVDLGLQDGEWDSFGLPSSFDPKRRPIYVVPRADMRAKTKATEWPKMIGALRELLQTYDGERVLVHTVSYELTQMLMGGLEREFRSRLVTYGGSASRVEALTRFRKQPGAVLLAPSMDRGVDLPDADCRCVVIARIPFPDLGDRQISKRLHGTNGQNWYTVQTIRRIVQATGRSVRHDLDWADAWILDAQFTKLYNQYSRWFPKWWKEAIDWKRGGRDALKVRGGARAAAEGGR